MQGSGRDGGGGGGGGGGDKKSTEYGKGAINLIILVPHLQGLTCCTFEHKCWVVS